MIDCSDASDEKNCSKSVENVHTGVVLAWIVGKLLCIVTQMMWVFGHTIIDLPYTSGRIPCLPFFVSTKLSCFYSFSDAEAGILIVKLQKYAFR